MGAWDWKRERKNWECWDFVCLNKINLIPDLLKLLWSSSLLFAWLQTTELPATHMTPLHAAPSHICCGYRFRSVINPHPKISLQAYVYKTGTHHVTTCISDWQVQRSVTIFDQQTCEKQGLESLVDLPSHDRLNFFPAKHKMQNSLDEKVL